MYRENTVFIYDMIYDTIIYDITSHIIHLKNIVNMNFKATMIQCGNLWKKFDIQRSCKQRDHVDPYLSIFYAEIFATLIKQNKNIRGICIKTTEHKISDVYIFYCDKIESSYLQKGF